MATKILLTTQEVEFAAASRHFLGEKDRIASEQIDIGATYITIPSDESIRKAFLDLGVARTMKVFQLAIENRAIPLDQVPPLVSALAAFNGKLLTALLPSHGNAMH